VVVQLRLTTAKYCTHKFAQEFQCHLKSLGSFFGSQIDQCISLKEERQPKEPHEKKKEEKKRHHFLYRLIVPFLMPILLLFVCLIFLSLSVKCYEVSLQLPKFVGELWKVLIIIQLLFILAN
jgi:H+/gluconate symporter-like permease